MNTYAVRARDVSKSFPVHKYHKNLFQAVTRWRNRSVNLREDVLRNVTFDIRHGEKVALVGRNGSGKTTLLRLLSNIYALDGGTIQLAEPPCVLFDANVGTAPLLSVIDNVFLFAALHEIEQECIASRLDEILRLAELDAHRFTPFRDLSKGQRQRFALSIFLQTPRRFIIFDEALANLDVGFLQACDRYFAALRQTDKTILMTLHDGAFLRRHCDRALWLERGQIYMDNEVNVVLDAYEKSFA